MEGVNQTSTPPETAPESDGFEWAIVEVFGHRRHAGRAREEERFGAKMLRIDVPVDGDATAWRTIYYGGSSIFSYSLTDEATVMRINGRRPPPSLTVLRADSQDGEEEFSGEHDGGDF